MRFNYDNYEKVFPKTDPEPEIDSAVEGYTPTAEDKGKEAAETNASEVVEPAQPEEVQPDAQEDISQN